MDGFIQQAHLWKSNSFHNRCLVLDQPVNITVKMTLYV